MTLVAGTTEPVASGRRYIGIAGTGDNAVVLETDDISGYSAFLLFSSAGAWDIVVTLDGTNYTTSVLAMTDMHAVDLAPVVVAAAGKCYGVRGLFKKIRVLQNGGVAVANFSMIAYKL